MRLRFGLGFVSLALVAPVSFVACGPQTRDVVSSGNGGGSSSSSSSTASSGSPQSASGSGGAMTASSSSSSSASNSATSSAAGPSGTSGTAASSGPSGTSATSATSATSSSSSSSSGAAPETIYVIDSTSTLFTFNALGTALSHVALPNPVGKIHGGGITVAAGVVYVTMSQSSDHVGAFDVTTLATHGLPMGSFANLNLVRGIVFDANVDKFFVGNGNSTVKAYDASGTAITLSGTFPGAYGPSGIAYDPDDHTIWVANYQGQPPASPPLYGVTEYTETGAAAQTFSYGSQFVTPYVTTEPYSIAVCPRAVAGGNTLVLVGFIDDESNQGTRSVQAYTTSGTKVGPPATGPLMNPYAIACGASGSTVYIADVSGLYKATIGANGLANLASAGFGGLTAPILGVFVTSP